jgi:hypothetical protein
MFGLDSFDILTQRGDFRSDSHYWRWEHNSKAVHRAYVKYVEVIMPSLTDWETEWKKFHETIDFKWCTQ